MIGVGALGPVRPTVVRAETAGPGHARTAEARAPVGPHPGARAGRCGAPDAGSGRTPPGLDEERQAWVVLATVDGLGERTLGHLLLTHGSARRVLALAAAGRLGPALRGEDGDGGERRVRGLPARTHAGIAEAAADAPARLATLADMRLWALTLLDTDYPDRLRRIPDPPPVLFGRGDPALLHHPATVAIVGTRRPTPAGRVLAARLARGLAVAGVAVVSGLAIGIDGAAHAATAEADRPTLAVIGSGHARPGPHAHRALLERILGAGGAVVGELPPGAHATRGTYPRRNRLISALADAVVVVEAPERSGALITGRHALEQGVPLHVYAGGGTGTPWAGCRRILAETSAEPFWTAEELIGTLLRDAGQGTGAGAGTAAGGSAAPGLQADGADGGDGGPVLGLRAVVPPSSEAMPRLGAIERRVARILAGGPASADGLAAATGLAPGVVSGVLTMLQLRGLAATLGPLNLPAGLLLSASAESLGPSTRRAAGARRE